MKQLAQQVMGIRKIRTDSHHLQQSFTRGLMLVGIEISQPERKPVL